jgi:hypothetical protein
MNPHTHIQLQTKLFPAVFIYNIATYTWGRENHLSWLCLSKYHLPQIKYEKEYAVKYVYSITINANTH